MRKRNKWLRAMSIALSCAVLATTAPMNVLATEVNVVSEVQSVTVPVLLDLESDILSYGRYGTWKENVPLSIEVNGVRTELKKDGSSVNVDFKNGDTVKLIVSDDIELYSGTVTVVDTSVNVVTEKDNFGSMKYNINYDSASNNLVISGKYWSVGGVGSSHKYYDYATYTLNAITSEGTAIQGITLTDTTVDGYTYGNDEENGEIKWGNGNSIYYEWDYVQNEYEAYYKLNGILIKATDENGYADSTAPYKDEKVDGIDFSGLRITFWESSSGKVYADNGLVDIDMEYYPTLQSLGNVSSKATPFVDEYGILGEYYMLLEDMEAYGKESILLKDEEGNEIATVEINNFKIQGNIEGNCCLGGQNDKYEDCVFTYDTNIQMAEDMDNWNVTVDFSDNTFNIKAIKTISTDDNTQNDTNKPEEDNNTSDVPYEVTLPADKTTISASDFAIVLEANKTQDVVIKSNNNITFTFAKGTMANVDGMESYDFGSSVVSDFANAGNMGSSVTKDNFVTRINYNYSGKLPATAEIKIYVGTAYAEGTTLYYSKMVEDGFKLIQSVKVDKDGYITITQDSCSDYVVTTNELTVTTPEDTQKPEEDTNKPEDTQKPEEDTTTPEDTTKPENDKTEEAPKTGDNSNIFVYVTMLVCGVGAVLMAMQKKLSR